MSRAPPARGDMPRRCIKLCVIRDLVALVDERVEAVNR
jgi:hypothetical protein